MGDSFGQGLAEASKELHVSNPRDMIAHAISRAIKTGTGGVRNYADNDSFIAGRVSAFVGIAADLMYMAYGTDPQAAKNRLRLLVKDVRDSWTQAERLNPAKLGAEAHVLVGQLLELPQAD